MFEIKYLIRIFICLASEYITIFSFIGVDCAVNFAVTTLTDSWLTASFKFEDLPNNGKDITIELPRLPLLLSPGKTEKFTFYITSNVELNATIPYTVCLTDASVEGNIEQYGVFEVHIKTPMIQAMSSDGVNKVTFPPIQEKSSLIKSFVLVSDCSADLQLELSIAESDSVFAIKSVQEILKSDVNKVLMERQGSIEEIQIEKAKTKGMNRQLCRLSSGNAITLRVQMNAPKLSDLQRGIDFYFQYFHVLLQLCCFFFFKVCIFSRCTKIKKKKSTEFYQKREGGFMHYQISLVHVGFFVTKQIFIYYFLCNKRV